jgi:hypothetical protein
MNLNPFQTALRLNQETIYFFNNKKVENIAFSLSVVPFHLVSGGNVFAVVVLISFAL